MASKCLLCQEIFPSQKRLVIHERAKHRNNKIIPHCHSLTQPLLEQITFYQDAFIVLIKKRLGFNRHAVGAKQVSINAFPENIFGEAGEHRLKQLVNYDYWNIQQDPNLKTVDYVLFMDHVSSYSINFIWLQSELEENANSREFSDRPAETQENQPKSQEPNPQVHDIDSHKNSSNNIELTQSRRNYRFILPRVPFQQLNR
ncbi:3932_t:CDS:2 [Gigaspora rosea]|nr:3932_t:CDS:2 [Gigaspora rosea]